MSPAVTPVAMIDVLWQRVTSRIDVTPDGCWLWTGSRNSAGYGHMGAGRRNLLMLVHRVAVLASGRDIPDGMEVDHLCHDPRECAGGPSCPHRRCVNPDHLQVVTHAENTQRAQRNALGFCRLGHPHSLRGNGSRYCSTCHRDRQRASRDRARSAS